MSLVFMGFLHNIIFDLCNGIKQGGVISAIVFILYIDNLFLNLKESRFGCHISYIHDNTLISRSIRVLNKILSICADFANNYLK